MRREHAHAGGPAPEPDRHELQAPPYISLRGRSSHRAEAGRRGSLRGGLGGCRRAGIRPPAGRADPRKPRTTSRHGFACGADGGVEVFTGKAELGQNIRTSLAQAVADELHVPFGSRRDGHGRHGAHAVRHGHVREPIDADDGAAAPPRGSSGAPGALRDGGAAMGCRCRQVEASDGRVVHPTSGRAIAFGDLTAGHQIAHPIGTPATINDRDGWHVAGTREAKVSGRDFVTGRHQFPSDITRPGLLHGAVVRPPTIGATLQDAASAALLAAGATARLVRDADFLGVVAPDVTAARTAAASVEARWSAAPRRCPPGVLFDDSAPHGLSSRNGRRVRHARKRSGRRGAHRRGDVHRRVYFARAARAESGGGGVVGRRPDGVDRHAASVRRAHRAGRGVPRRHPSACASSCPTPGRRTAASTRAKPPSRRRGSRAPPAVR